MTTRSYQIQDKAVLKAAQAVWDAVVASPHNLEPGKLIVGYPIDRVVMKVMVYEDSVTGVYSFSLGVHIKNGGFVTQLTRFELQPTPACCGITQFCNFSHNNHFDQTLFNNYMNAMFAWMKNNRGERLGDIRDFYPYVADRRVSAIVVTREKGNDYGETPRNAPVKFTPERLVYPYVYNWFKENCEIQGMTSFYNTNSGNVCHQLVALV